MISLSCGRSFMLMGSVAMALAVAMGAYAAHGAARVLDANNVQVLQTAVSYQVYHSLGLLILGGLLHQELLARRLGVIAGVTMLSGLLLFSGSLYAISLFSLHAGLLTPFGGILLLLSWLLLGLSVVFGRNTLGVRAEK